MKTGMRNSLLLSLTRACKCSLSYIGSYTTLVKPLQWKRERYSIALFLLRWEQEQHKRRYPCTAPVDPIPPFLLH